jgi:hypothetical protein
MKTRLLAVLLVAGVLVTGHPMSAHHGSAAYEAERVEMTGVTVREFLWANPHCIVRFDVTDESGTVTQWAGELGSPSALVIDGLARTSLQPGDVVTIDITVSTTRNPVGWIRSITFADGSVWEAGQVLTAG